jgi:hypothetical protein
MTMWPRRSDRRGTALAMECEAFLAGRYVELCESRGEHVPTWAWINLLAHGTEDQLRETMEHDPCNGPWSQARGFLAGELLGLMDADRLSLSAFQRHVLVPLELDTISSSSAVGWRPSQFVSGVLGNLPGRHSSDDR